MKHVARLAAAAVVLTLSGVASASAPAPAPAPDDAAAPSATDASSPADPLFPGSGRLALTGATGIPFLAVGEVAYGLSDRFALGAMVGATPDVGSTRGTMGLGLRPRGVLFASGSWRSALIAPVFYYPDVPGFGGLDPWVLARPTVSLERRLPGGASVDVAFGAIVAACTEGILTLGKEHTMMGGAWDTAAVGGALPLTERVTSFAEGSLVMRGFEPARDWIGGVPVVVIVGVTTRL